MNKKSLILIGAGGHANSCIDVIEKQNKFKIKGLIGLKSEVGQRCLGYEVIGDDDYLTSLAQKQAYALVCLGQIKSPETRKKSFLKLKELSFDLPSIVSPYAYVSNHAQVGNGTIIMHGAIINAGVVIGENCIINSRALIEHDTIVGDNCHISTGSIINGGVIVGDGCFIGSGSIVREGIKISNNSLVGFGSIICRDLDS